MRVKPGQRAIIAWWAERVAFVSLVGAAACSPFSLALQEVGLVVAIAAWLVKTLATRRWSPRTAANLPLVLWFLAGVLSMVHSVSFLQSLRGLQKILKAAGIVFVTADVLRTKRRVSTILCAVAGSALLVSLDGLIQMIRGTDLLYQHVLGHAPGGLVRMTASFGHATALGVYVATVLPLGCVVALCATRPSSRWGFRVVVGLLSAVLVCTLSRAGALAATVSILTFGILRRAWKTLAALGVLGIVGVVNFPSSLREWVLAQGSWFHALVQPQRLEMWQAAMNMIRAHPIIGIGVNTFVLNYARYKLPSDPIHSAYAHNHYLHLTAELGVVGLAIFGWLFVRTARVWRTLLRDPNSWIRTVSVGLGCSLIAFLTGGLLESALYSSRINLSFWLCLGLLHGISIHRAAIATSLTPASSPTPSGTMVPLAQSTPHAGRVAIPA